ncbi:sensor histidine kinase [uncultured Kordia sp.]|uniref:tetratricopeptide repeat-containing sensor histidine kinase n=1 Tax=uncultured Kordia sp. TaxID=507699 RepID=UPI0026107F96|nr:sensor histidine kinase [uncultured Kordia sp.]
MNKIIVHIRCILFWTFVLFSVNVLSKTSTHNIQDSSIKNKDTTLLRLNSNYQKAKNDSIKCHVLLEIAAYQMHRDVDDAKRVLQEANQIYQSGKYNFKPITEATIQRYYGITYRRSGYFKEALEAYQKTKDIYIKVGDSIDISRIDHLFAVLYSSMGDDEKSEAYAREAIRINTRIHEKKGLAFNYSLIGDIFKQKENIDSALYYYQKSKQLFQKINREDGWRRINSKIAKILEENGKYAEALKYYFEDLDNKMKVGYDQGISSAYARISNVYIKLNNYKKAEEFAEKGLKAAQEGKLIRMISSSYLQKAKVYEKFKNYKEAYLNKELYYTYRDSTLDIENVKKIQELELTYEFRKEKVKDSMQLVKEREIAETNVHLLEAKNKLNRQWLLFGGLGLVALFSIIYLVRSRRFAISKQTLQEQFSHDLIKGQEEERSRLARELHDSIGQKLMLLSKQTKRIDNPNMENLASSTLEEVRTISRGLHPSNLERLGLTEAVNALVYDINANTDLFFTENIENVDNLLSKESELHLYRIIQESLSNIVKHSEAKAVTLDIQKEQQKVTVSINDNGKGFDIDSKRKSISLGIKTLFERARIINASIDLESNIGKGTKLTVSIPI